MLIKVLIMLVVIMIAMHTASYGLWALRKGNRRGAFGAFALAGAAVLAPLAVWLATA